MCFFYIKINQHQIKCDRNLASTIVSLWYIYILLDDWQLSSDHNINSKADVNTKQLLNEKEGRFIQLTN